MELPRIKHSDGGVLGGLKSRLGFADSQADYADDDGFDEGYDEFEEYGPGYRADDDFVPTHARDSFAPATVREPRSAGRHSATGSVSSNLVSLDDVRASTRIPESLNRDPLPERRASSASMRSARTMVEPAIAAHAGTPNARAQAAAAASSQERSESLNSLFGSGDGSAQSSAAASRGFDPYDALSGRGATQHTPTRSVAVVRPTAYADAEAVAKSLKAGDAVVLVLKQTPSDLVMRLLDFSFGASCALGASVDCVAEKVFAITAGAPLTQGELSNLRGQGIL